MSKITLVEQSTAPSAPATDKVVFYAKTDRMLYNKNDSGLEVRVNEVKGADVASASTIDLDSATGNLVDVTGTTTITAVTLAEGKQAAIRFTGILTLTHGASLVLPNAGGNITTAAGDCAILRGYASGVVRCINYQRLDGSPLQFTLTDASVSQAKLKTTTGEVSTNTSSALLTLPGGEYGFYPQIRATASANLARATLGGFDEFSMSAWGASYLTRIVLGQAGSTSVYAQQRYVQASPPYDLGDGEVPLFVFALVDSLGNIVSTYIAPDPPWANNGPTNIRADFNDKSGKAWQRRRTRINRALLADPARRDTELAKLDAQPQLIEVTQALKQADMPLIPHPFQGNDLTGKTIVLLDPVAPLTERLLRLHEAGEYVSLLLHDDYLRLGNVPLVRAGPPGVVSVEANWK